MPIWRPEEGARFYGAGVTAVRQLRMWILGVKSRSSARAYVLFDS